MARVAGAGPKGGVRLEQHEKVRHRGLAGKAWVPAQKSRGEIFAGRPRKRVVAACIGRLKIADDAQCWE